MGRLRCGLAASAVACLAVGYLTLVGASDAGSFFSDDSPVETLTRSSFISSVLEGHRPAMVWFYSGSDCPQCEGVAGVIDSASKKLASWGMALAAVDVSTETKLARELGFPKGVAMMLKVYHSQSTPNPYGGLPVRSEEYVGNFQDARALQKNVLSAIPNLVTTADARENASALKEALAKGDENYAAVLLTDTGKASPILRVLATELRGKVAAVQARASKLDDGEEQGAANLKGVLEGVVEVTGWEPSLPAFLLVNRKSGAGVAYEGDLDDAKGIMAFIRDGADMSSTPSAESSGDSGDDRAGASSTGGVLGLEPETLARLEEDGVEALVVAFVEGGDASAIPEWDTVTKGLRAQIRAGVFDCSANPSECKEAGKRVPFVRVYPHARGVDGDNRGAPSAFSAGEIEEAVAEAEASLPEIVTVVPAGTDPRVMQDALQTLVGTSIIREGSPMCLFVLSRREQPNLVVKTIAAEFQQTKIRAVFISQPDQEVLVGLGVAKLPAMVLMFPAREGMGAPNDGKPGPDGDQAMMTANYSPTRWGPVSHENVRNFILSHLSSVNLEAFFAHVREMADTAAMNGEKLPAELERFMQEDGQADQGPASPRGDDGNPSPFMGVPEATPETWSSSIGGGAAQARTVGIFLLDRHADSFASSLEAAEKAAERAFARVGNRGGAFAWVDAPCQEGFATSLGVSDSSEVPVLVVYSERHQKSARFVGAWEEESLALFLGKALGGREPMFPLGDEAPRLEAIDCSARGPSSGVLGAVDGDAEDDDMGDFMAEILAEEAEAKRRLEEEVARGLEELKAAEGEGAEEAAPKKKKKIVKRKKKRGGSSTSGARSEL